MYTSASVQAVINMCKMRAHKHTHTLLVLRLYRLIRGEGQFLTWNILRRMSWVCFWRKKVAECLMGRLFQMWGLKCDKVQKQESFSCQLVTLTDSVTILYTIPPPLPHQRCNLTSETERERDFLKPMIKIRSVVQIRTSLRTDYCISV